MTLPAILERPIPLPRPLARAGRALARRLLAVPLLRAVLRGRHTALGHLLLTVTLCVCLVPEPTDSDPARGARMDEVDMAQTEIEHAIRGLVMVAKSRPEIRATGECLNCGEPLPQPQRWCDAGCRDDWDRNAASPAQRGG